MTVRQFTHKLPQKVNEIGLKCSKMFHDTCVYRRHSDNRLISNDFLSKILNDLHTIRIPNHIYKTHAS